MDNTTTLPGPPTVPRPTDTASVNPGTPELDSLIASLRSHAKYKARSHDTSKSVHIPLLQSHLRDFPAGGPRMVLLGDSMFERMTTTGQSPNFPAPWPSPALFPSPDTPGLPAEDKDRRFEGVFNAGVGGDKIQNVIYRLVGDEERGLPGLLPILAGSVQLWVVHVGTNNLSPKKGWSRADEAALRELAGTLLAANPTCKVVLTQLFTRTDVPWEIVSGVNETVKGIAKRLMEEVGSSRVDYWNPPGADTWLSMEKHLDDHVHLNLEGYRLWVEVLHPLFQGFVQQRAETEKNIGLA